MQPEVLIADEAVSALDVSIQAQILNLFARLSDELGLAMIFIAHDLAVVSHVADRVAIMYLGRIVEEGPVDAVFRTPRHPYTRALLDAHPDPYALGALDETAPISGDIPSPPRHPLRMPLPNPLPLRHRHLRDRRPGASPRRRPPPSGLPRTALRPPDGGLRRRRVGGVSRGRPAGRRRTSCAAP